MLALSLALAMVLGMTAFAKESPDTNAEEKIESQTPGVEAEPVFVQFGDDDKADLKDVLPAEENQKFWDKVNEGSPAGNSAGAEPELVVVLKLTGTVPTDGMVKVSLPGIEASDAKEYTFWAYHYNNGVCEVLPVTILADGLIRIEGVTKFSNFVLVAWPITTTGDNGGNNNGNNNNGTTNAGTSPKTGESTSMAMLIVLVSLAGASVLGAKRAFSAR